MDEMDEYMRSNYNKGSYGTSSDVKGSSASKRKKSNAERIGVKRWLRRRRKGNKEGRDNG